MSNKSNSYNLEDAQTIHEEMQKELYIMNTAINILTSSWKSGIVLPGYDSAAKQWEEASERYKKLIEDYQVGEEKS